MYISLLLSYNIYWMKYIKEKNRVHVPVFGVLFNGSYVICSGSKHQFFYVYLVMKEEVYVED